MYIYKEVATTVLANKERVVFDSTRIVEDKDDINNKGDNNTRSNSSLSALKDLTTVIKTCTSR